MNRTRVRRFLPRLSRLAASVLAALGALPAHALDPAALPTGGQVAAGSAVITQSGARMDVNQATPRAILNWSSFNIGSGAHVNFAQPSASSVALNRVTTSAGASDIQGRLTANGQVFLINPNGVLFGRTAQVDVGGLVATSLNLSDANFLAGRYGFAASGAAGPVVNQGTLRAADGGYIALLAPEVRNEGVISARLGTVALGAGEKVTLDFAGDRLVSLVIDEAALGALVENRRAIHAEGGTVLLAARSAGDVAATVVNSTGLIQATSISERNGVIRLDGGERGIVAVSGTLDASGRGAGETGGTVQVLGDKVGLFPGATLEASGDAGGGTVLVGGNFQGQGPERNATKTYVAADAQIKADALGAGSGGRVVVWADDLTRYYGSISARGGVRGGDGGFVEVSGKQHLDFHGRADVGAPRGTGGKVLLDPQDILLNTSTQAAPPNSGVGTPDVAFGDPPDPGTYTIQIADVTGYAELYLQATRDITLAAASPITMGAGNTIRFEAGNNITVNSAITTSGTPSTARPSITLTADADLSGSGTVALNAALAAQQGGITISGAGVTSTAAGTIVSTGAAGQNGGNVNISATGTVNLAGAITANGGANAGGAGFNAGSVNISGTTISSAAITAQGSAGAANSKGGSGGSVTLSASNGDITASGNIQSQAGNAAGTAATGAGIPGGGNISLTTSGGTGNITAAQLLAAGTTGAFGTAGGDGGNVTVNASAGTSGNVTVPTVSSYAGNATTGTGGGAGRAGGTVSITSKGTLSFGAISTRGSNAVTAGQNGGAAGEVTIDSTDGSLVTSSAAVAVDIDTRGGNGSGAGNGGAGGNVTLTDPFRISSAYVISANVGTGGTATGGTVQFGDVDSLAAAANALTVTSTAGTVTTGNLGGAAATNSLGAVTLAGNTITTGSINTTGRNNAAGSAVTLTAQAVGGTTVNGSITTVGGVNTAAAAGRAGGNINVTNGVIAVNGAIDTSGSAAFAGTSNVGGNAGTATLNASGATSTVTLGGNITATGGAAASAGPARAGGNGGTIAISDPALLAANIQIDATGGAGAGGGAAGIGRNVTFSSTVDSSGAGRTLTVNTSGATTFSGIVGGLLPLASLTTDAAGTGSIAASVTTTGAQTYNDTVSVTAAATLASTGGGSLTANGAVTATAGLLTLSTTGNVTFNNAANNFGTVAFNANDVALRDTNGVILGASTFTGTLAVTAGGSITQAGAITQSAGTGAASFTTGAGVITLTQANNFTGSVSATNSGANAVRITDSNAIQLGTINIGNNLTVNAVGITQDAGGLTVPGTATFNAGAGPITLTEATNNFTGAVSLNNSGANNVAITDANAIVLGTSSVGTGTLTVTATGANSITQTGAITQAASAGVASFATGDGVITLTQANNFTGPVSATNTAANAIQINDANAIQLGTINTANNLTVNAVGITQNAGGIMVGGTSAFNGGAGVITLTTATNDFTGAVSLANTGANNVSLLDNNALVLGASTIGTGTGNLIRAGGSLTASGAVVVGTAGKLTLSAGDSAGTVDPAAALDINAPVTFAANNAANALTFVNTGTGGINLGANVSTGTTGANTIRLNASNGAITQSAGVITATNLGLRAAGDITLSGANLVTTLAGAISGGVGNDFTYNDSNGLVIGTVAVDGTLFPATTGITTQGGDITVTAGGGYAVNTSVASNGGDISLVVSGVVTGGTVLAAAQSINAGTGSVFLQAGTLATNPITLNAGSTVSGSGGIELIANNMTINATANVNAGASSVTLRPRAPANQILVGGADAANVLGLTDAELDRVTAGTVVLGGPSHTGNVNVSAAISAPATYSTLTLQTTGAGTITDSGGSITVPALNLAATSGITLDVAPLTVSGVTTITAGAGDSVLSTATNNFGTVGVVSGNSVTLVDSNAIQLGTVNVTNNLSVNAVGITQTGGGITVGGTSTFSGGAGVIALTTATNDFTGPVALSNSGTSDISVRDANALALGASTAGRNLSAVAGGRLTVAGTLASGGTTGTSIELAGHAFTNSAGAGALVPGAGSRFLVWSSNPDPFGGATPDARGGLSYDFKQYDATFGVTAPAQLAGNGFLYTLAPLITPGLTGAVSKTYDGSTVATLAAGNYTTSGAVDGDTVTLTNPGTGAYDTRNVGTSKNVSATGITITSATNGAATVYGYQLSTTTASGNIGEITTRAITVTAQTDTKAYDGSTNSAVTPTITSGSLAPVGGDTASFTQVFDNRNVGTGKTLTPTGSVSDGNSGNNYAVTFAADNTGVINQRAITVTAQTDTRTYDGSTSSAVTPTITVGSLAPFGGDTANFAQAFDNRNAGSGKTLTAAGSVTDGNSGNNYAVTFVADNTGVINQRAITVTAQTETKTYDGATSSAGAPTITSGSLAPVGGDTANFIQAFGNRNAGTGKALNASGSVTDGNSGNNYAITFVADNTGVINQRAITVTAQTDTKTYDGSTSSVGTPTITSGTLALVGGDTASFTQVFNNRNASTGKALNPTGSVTDGNSGNNYAITFVADNTGVINQRAITVTAQTDTKTYDGLTSSATTPTITSGSLAPFGGDVSAFTQIFDNRNAGTGKTLTPTGSVSDGNGGGNYVLTFAPNATGVITARSLTVTAATDTKVYDGTTVSGGAPTITAGSLVGGDSASFSQAYDTKNAGTGKTLTAAGSVSDGNGGSNYALAFVSSTTGVITAASLSVTADNKTRPENTPNPPFTATFSAFQPGDSAASLGGALVFATPATQASPAGLYPITPSGLTSTNYTIAFIDGVLTVTTGTTPPPSGITRPPGAQEAVASTITPPGIPRTPAGAPSSAEVLNALPPTAGAQGAIVVEQISPTISVVNCGIQAPAQGCGPR